MTPFQLQLSIKTSGLWADIWDIWDVGESTLTIGEQTVGETTRRRNDRIPFEDYDLHKVTALSADIAGMDVLSLNHWLSKFVVEVAKKSGERYPLKTVYGIICALKRYLEEKNGSEALNPLDASDKR